MRVHVTVHVFQGSCDQNFGHGAAREQNFGKASTYKIPQAHNTKRTPTRAPKSLLFHAHSNSSNAERPSIALRSVTSSSSSSQFDLMSNRVMEPLSELDGLPRPRGHAAWCPKARCPKAEVPEGETKPSHHEWTDGGSTRACVQGSEAKVARA